MDTQKRMSRHLGMPINLTVQGSKQSVQHIINLLNENDFTKIRKTITEVGLDGLVNDILTRDNILPKSFLRQIAPSIFPSQNYSVADKQAFFDGVDTYSLRWACAGHDQITPEIDRPIVEKINKVADASSRKTRFARSWEFNDSLDDIQGVIGF